MKLKLLSVALLSAASLSAFSEGVMPVAPSFTGFYLGGGAGFTSIFTNNTFTVTATPSTSASAPALAESINRKFTDTGILFVGQFGYGYEFDNHAYLAGEASINYTPFVHEDDTSASRSVSSTVTVVTASDLKRSYDPSYNIDAVLGYAVYPNILPYAKVGVSFNNAVLSRNTDFTAYSSTGSILASGVAQNQKLSKYRTGFNAGLGVKYLAHEQWMLASEFLYTYYANSSGSINPTVTGYSALTETASAKPYALSLYGTASYLFNM